MKFLLTVDTEADAQWQHSDKFTTENLKHIPRFINKASGEHFRNLGDAHILHWHIILHLKTKGYKIYNLQGAGDFKRKTGVYLFKAGFGGKFVKLLPEFDHIIGP